MVLYYLYSFIHLPDIQILLLVYEFLDNKEIDHKQFNISVCGQRSLLCTFGVGPGNIYMGSGSSSSSSLRYGLLIMVIKIVLTIQRSKLLHALIQTSITGISIVIR